ncbi:MAG: TonB-dependent receptor [Novosphingobium sp.]
MKSSHLYAVTALSTILLAGFATPAVAAQSQGASAADGASDVIIVTARRSEESLQDVPISITVLDREALSKRNVISTADLGNYVPSLAVNQQFGPEKASFVIRGFTQSYHTAPTVGVYFADVIAPRANGPTTAGNGAGVGSMFDLENIQVLKGPQGTLFGRNTTGGAILLVPTKPKDRLEGYVEGTLGNYDMRRVEAVLNVPLSDTFRVRLGVDRNTRDGYITNHSGVGPRNYRDTDYIAARLSLVADLTPDLENYTIFSYSRSDTNGDSPKVTICDQQGTADFLQGDQTKFLSFLGCAQVARQEARGDGLWDVESNLANPLQRITQWQAINTTTWQASDALTIKNIMSYSQYTEDASFTLWGDNFIIPPGFPGEGHLFTKTLNLERGRLGHTTDQWTFTEELQLQGRALEGRLNWQAGAYLEISKPLGWNSQLVDIFASCSDVKNTVCTNPLGIGQISDDSTKDYFNNKGLYAQATYKLSDQFSVTGGFRYTMDRQRDVARRLSVIEMPAGSGTWASVCQPTVDPVTGNLTDSGVVTDPTVCDVTRTIKSNRPTWIVGAEYRPMDDVMLFAKWSRGYRMGAITSNSIGYETVGPEKVDTYEIGAKTSFRGAISGYFNVTGFYNDFRDQQLTVGTVVADAYLSRITPASPNVNAGKSRMWGIEADASIRPFAGFQLDASYTYLDTKLLKFTPPPTPVYYKDVFSSTAEGGPLPLSPKNRVTVTGTYTLPLDESVGRISFGATYVHTDAHQATSPAATPVYLVKESNLLNLNANWYSVLGSNFDLAFFMTNVTNEGLILYPLQSVHQIGTDGGHVNEPRMWGFRLKYRFGEGR